MLPAAFISLKNTAVPDAINMGDKGLSSAYLLHTVTDSQTAYPSFNSISSVSVAAGDCPFMPAPSENTGRNNSLTPLPPFALDVIYPNQSVFPLQRPVIDEAIQSIKQILPLNLWKVAKQYCDLLELELTGVPSDYPDLSLQAMFASLVCSARMPLQRFPAIYLKGVPEEFSSFAGHMLKFIDYSMAESPFNRKCTEIRPVARALGSDREKLSLIDSRVRFPTRNMRESLQNLIHAQLDLGLGDSGALFNGIDVEMESVYEQLKQQVKRWCTVTAPSKALVPSFANLFASGAQEERIPLRTSLMVDFFIASRPDSSQLLSFNRNSFDSLYHTLMLDMFRTFSRQLTSFELPACAPNSLLHALLGCMSWAPSGSQQKATPQFVTKVRQYCHVLFITLPLAIMTQSEALKSQLTSAIKTLGLGTICQAALDFIGEASLPPSVPVCQQLLKIPGYLNLVKAWSVAIPLALIGQIFCLIDEGEYRPLDFQTLVSQSMEAAKQIDQTNDNTLSSLVESVLSRIFANSPAFLRSFIVMMLPKIEKFPDVLSALSMSSELLMDIIPLLAASSFRSREPEFDRSLPEPTVDPRLECIQSYAIDSRGGDHSQELSMTRFFSLVCPLLDSGGSLSVFTPCWQFDPIAIPESYFALPQDEFNMLHRRISTTYMVSDQAPPEQHRPAPLQQQFDTLAELSEIYQSQSPQLSAKRERLIPKATISALVSLLDPMAQFSCYQGGWNTSLPHSMLHSQETINAMSLFYPSGCHVSSVGLSLALSRYSQSSMISKMVFPYFFALREPRSHRATDSLHPFVLLMNLLSMEHIDDIPCVDATVAAPLTPLIGFPDSARHGHLAFPPPLTVSCPIFRYLYTGFSLSLPPQVSLNSRKLSSLGVQLLENVSMSTFSRLITTPYSMSRQSRLSTATAYSDFTYSLIVDLVRQGWGTARSVLGIDDMGELWQLVGSDDPMERLFSDTPQPDLPPLCWTVLSLRMQSTRFSMSMEQAAISNCITNWLKPFNTQASFTALQAPCCQWRNDNPLLTFASVNDMTEKLDGKYGSLLSEALLLFMPPTVPFPAYSRTEVKDAYMDGVEALVRDQYSHVPSLQCMQIAEQLPGVPPREWVADECATERIVSSCGCPGSTFERIEERPMSPGKSPTLTPPDSLITHFVQRLNGSTRLFSLLTGLPTDPRDVSFPWPLLGRNTFLGDAVRSLLGAIDNRIEMLSTVHKVPFVAPLGREAPASFLYQLLVSSKAAIFQTVQDQLQSISQCLVSPDLVLANAPHMMALLDQVNSGSFNAIFNATELSSVLARSTARAELELARLAPTLLGRQQLRLPSIVSRYLTVDEFLTVAPVVFSLTAPLTMATKSQSSLAVAASKAMDAALEKAGLGHERIDLSDLALSSSIRNGKAIVKEMARSVTSALESRGSRASITSASSMALVNELEQFFDLSPALRTALCFRGLWLWSFLTTVGAYSPELAVQWLPVIIGRNSVRLLKDADSETIRKAATGISACNFKGVHESLQAVHLFMACHLVLTGRKDTTARDPGHWIIPRGCYPLTQADSETRLPFAAWLEVALSLGSDTQLFQEGQSVFSLPLTDTTRTLLLSHAPSAGTLRFVLPHAPSLVGPPSREVISMSAEWAPMCRMLERGKVGPRCLVSQDTWWQQVAPFLPKLPAVSQFLYETLGLQSSNLTRTALMKALQTQSSEKAALYQEFAHLFLSFWMRDKLPGDLSSLYSTPLSLCIDCDNLATIAAGEDLCDPKRSAQPFIYTGGIFSDPDTRRRITSVLSSLADSVSVSFHCSPYYGAALEQESTGSNSQWRMAGCLILSSSQTYVASDFALSAFSPISQTTKRLQTRFNAFFAKMNQGGSLLLNPSAVGLKLPDIPVIRSSAPAPTTFESSLVGKNESAVAAMRTVVALKAPMVERCDAWVQTSPPPDYESAELLLQDSFSSCYLDHRIYGAMLEDFDATANQVKQLVEKMKPLTSAISSAMQTLSPTVQLPTLQQAGEFLGIGPDEPLWKVFCSELNQITSLQRIPGDYAAQQEEIRRQVAAYMPTPQVLTLPQNQLVRKVLAPLVMALSKGHTPVVPFDYTQDLRSLASIVSCYEAYMRNGQSLSKIVCPTCQMPCLIHNGLVLVRGPHGTHCPNCITAKPRECFSLDERMPPDDRYTEVDVDDLPGLVSGLINSLAPDVISVIDSIACPDVSAAVTIAKYGPDSSLFPALTELPLGPLFELCNMEATSPQQFICIECKEENDISDTVQALAKLQIESSPSASPPPPLESPSPEVQPSADLSETQEVQENSIVVSSPTESLKLGQSLRPPGNATISELGALLSSLVGGYDPSGADISIFAQNSITSTQNCNLAPSE